MERARKYQMLIYSLYLDIEDNSKSYLNIRRHLITGGLISITSVEDEYCDQSSI